MPVVYDFWYWPDIPGRGEFVRLTMEALSIEYRDCAREEGAQALIDDMKRHADMPAFAPRYLRENSAVIATPAKILLYLPAQPGVEPWGMRGPYWLDRVQLTIAGMNNG